MESRSELQLLSALVDEALGLPRQLDVEARRRCPNPVRSTRPSSAAGSTITRAAPSSRWSKEVATRSE